VDATYRAEPAFAAPDPNLHPDPAASCREISNLNRTRSSLRDYSESILA